MNHDRKNNLPGAESDPMVSAEYRATATERTPPALDAAVLKKAEAAARESGLQVFTAFWFRPLAFVATLGLALALMLELTRMETLPVLDPNFGAGRQETESQPAVPSNNADIGTTDVHFKLDSPAGKQQSAVPPASGQETPPNVESGRRQRLEPGTALTIEIKASEVSDSASAPAGDVRVSADFAEMIEASSKHMPQNDIATETVIQNLSRTSVPEDFKAENFSAYRTPAAATIATTRPCTEEQTASSVTWWQCISNLREAGRHDEARAEMDLFNKVHPDFRAPEILPSQ